MPKRPWALMMLQPSVRRSEPSNEKTSDFCSIEKNPTICLKKKETALLLKRNGGGVGVAGWLNFDWGLTWLMVLVCVGGPGLCWMFVFNG